MECYDEEQVKYMINSRLNREEADMHPYLPLARAIGVHSRFVNLFHSEKTEEQIINSFKNGTHPIYYHLSINSSLILVDIAPDAQRLISKHLNKHVILENSQHPTLLRNWIMPEGQQERCSNVSVMTFSVYDTDTISNMRKSIKRKEKRKKIRKKVWRYLPLFNLLLLTALAVMLYVHK